MLDHVRLMRDDAGNELAALRQLHLLPDAPFMLMARIGHFQEITADPHLQNEIDDVLELNVEGVGPVPASPTHVIARALLRKASERMIEGLNAQRRPFAII